MERIQSSRQHDKRFGIPGRFFSFRYILQRIISYICLRQIIMS